ncbi:hypothetical protein C2845_PM01G32580 [Panicum miliaceum]|uniref:Uncharacterized protein n=1 Tax=Panicum miliaceum TaxID=4540 RepID=A0A3L6TQH2_PANMI|nr:hypothetical protein C2845_PM01G32580 [Panicum miliaceum]
MDTRPPAAPPWTRDGVPDFQRRQRVPQHQRHLQSASPVLHETSTTVARDCRRSRQQQSGGSGGGSTNHLPTPLPAPSQTRLSFPRSFFVDLLLLRSAATCRSNPSPHRHLIRSGSAIGPALLDRLAVPVRSANAAGLFVGKAGQIRQVATARLVGLTDRRDMVISYMDSAYFLGRQGQRN